MAFKSLLTDPGVYVAAGLTTTPVWSFLDWLNPAVASLVSLAGLAYLIVKVRSVMLDNALKRRQIADHDREK